MNAEQTVNSWLAGLNPADSRMVLNRYGQCQLNGDDGERCIVFVPSATSPEFFLSQDIAALPASLEARVYEELLQLNSPCTPARGAAIAFDTKTRNVRFVYAREIALTDIKTFCAVLENFLDAAREIRKRIRELVRAPENVRARRNAGGAGMNRTIPFTSKT